MRHAERVSGYSVQKPVEDLCKKEKQIMPRRFHFIKKKMWRVSSRWNINQNGLYYNHIHLEDTCLRGEGEEGTWQRLESNIDSLFVWRSVFFIIFSSHIHCGKVHLIFRLFSCLYFFFFLFCFLSEIRTANFAVQWTQSTYYTLRYTTILYSTLFYFILLYFYAGSFALLSREKKQRGKLRERVREREF